MTARVELGPTLTDVKRIEAGGASPTSPADALVLLASNLSSKDGETGSHCRRLAQWAVALGRALTLKPAELEALHLGGLVHDIGKLFIPDPILQKPAPLTVRERAIIQEHPVLGERLCTPIARLHPALPIVRHHHERYDGSGYPDRLGGEAIPLIARIVQVVDVFDALTSARAYKPAWTVDQALRTMRAEAERGWLDTRVLREFTLQIRNAR